MPVAKGLVDLPLEIQTRILEYVFHGAELKYWSKNPFKTSPLAPGVRCEQTEHNILLACKHFYTSFLLLYYKHLTFIYEITERGEKEGPPNTQYPFYQHLRRIKHHYIIRLNRLMFPFHYGLWPSLEEVIWTSEWIWGKAEPDVWKIDCRHYVSPEDEAGTQALVKKFGDPTWTRRPQYIPRQYRALHEVEVFISWRCVCDEMEAEQRPAECLAKSVSWDQRLVQLECVRRPEDENIEPECIMMG